MKKNSVIAMCISLILFLIHGYLAYASNYDNKQSIYKEIVDELLSTRTRIMNQALYGVDDLNIIFSNLEAIEREDLLEEDIKSIIYARENPTDYSFISGLELLKVDLLELKDSIYKLKVLVQWRIVEIEEEKIDVEYFIHMKQENGKFFLTGLEPVR